MTKALVFFQYQVAGDYLQLIMQTMKRSFLTNYLFYIA